MKDYILETCVDSVESAMAAAEGGADRLELCSNLIIGGTTPGPWLFEEIRKRSDIRIHALIRPRFGDFCYTDAEFSMIRNAVKDFRKMGAEGVVIGILKPDGTLNMEQMKELMDAAEKVKWCIHNSLSLELFKMYRPVRTVTEVVRLSVRNVQIAEVQVMFPTVRKYLYPFRPVLIMVKAYVSAKKENRA